MIVSGPVLASIAKMAKVLEFDDFSFTASGNQLEILGGNQSRTAVVKGTYDIQDGPETAVRYAHSVKRFADAVEPFAKEKVVEVEVSGHKMIFKVGRKVRRLSMVDPRYANTPNVPDDLPWVAHFEVPLSFLVDAADESGKFGSATLSVAGGNLKWNATNEEDSEGLEDSIEVPPGTPDCASVYTPALLSDLLAPAATGSGAKVDMGTDLPLSVSYQLPSGHARIWLAARI